MHTQVAKQREPWEETENRLPLKRLENPSTVVTEKRMERLEEEANQRTAGTHKSRFGLRILVEKKATRHQKRWKKKTRMNKILVLGKKKHRETQSLQKQFPKQMKKS